MVALTGLGSSARITDVEVAIGSRVASGQTVAKLDDRALLAQVDSAKAAKRAARAQLRVLGARLDDIADSRSTIAENRATAEDAAAELVRTRSELRGKLADAQAQRDQLSGMLENLPSLPSIPSSPPSVPESMPSAPPRIAPSGTMPDPKQLKANLEQLDAAIAQLTQMLTRIDAGLEKVQEGLSTLDDASAKTSDARSTLTGLQRVARAALDGRDAAIALAEAQRDLSVLRTPVDGVVVATVASGECVMPGAPVVTVRPDAPNTIDAWVSPAEAASLTIGDTAYVRIDSRPGETFSGRVSSIGVRALFPPTWVTATEVTPTRAVSVQVALTDIALRLPPGTPADVEVTPDR